MMILMLVVEHLDVFWSSEEAKGVFETHLVSVLPSTFSLGFSKESKDAWPIES